MKLLLLIGLMVAHSLTSAHAQTTQAPPGADLIVHNAKIHTGNPAQPAASALAVKNGRILGRHRCRNSWPENRQHQNHRFPRSSPDPRHHRRPHPCPLSMPARGSAAIPKPSRPWTPSPATTALTSACPSWTSSSAKAPISMWWTRRSRRSPKPRRSRPATTCTRSWPTVTPTRAPASCCRSRCTTTRTSTAPPSSSNRPRCTSWSSGISPGWSSGAFRSASTSAMTRTSRPSSMRSKSSTRRRRSTACAGASNTPRPSVPPISPGSRRWAAASPWTPRWPCTATASSRPTAATRPC